MNKWVMRIAAISLIGVFFPLVFSCAGLRERLGPPEKLEEGIRFRYHEPGAYRVVVAGDFNDWQFRREDALTIEMTKNEDGLWTVVVPYEEYAEEEEAYLEHVSRYPYKFVVNGNRWVRDPNVPRTDDDGNSILVVP
jgi:1,4-alpha-glucan branching enzyme